MSQLDFFNHNTHRSYPLVEPEVRPADDTDGWLAYCRFIVRPEADYDPSTSSFYLRAAIRNAASIDSLDESVSIDPGIHFIFESDAESLKNMAFLASFAGDNSYEDASITVISKRHAYELLGINTALPTAVETYLVEGTVISGNIDTIPDDITILSQLMRVEPALVLNSPEPAYGPGRGRVKIYNSPRTLYSPSDKCSQVGQVEQPTDYVLEATTELPVRFDGGHSTLVSQSVVLGSITIDANPGAGVEGFPCDESVLIGDETPNEDGTTQDGAARCQEVLRSINGSQGPHINILAMDGVQIASYPKLNRVIIGISGKDGRSCPTFDAAESVECIPDKDGVVCGENNVAVPCTPAPDSGVGYADPDFTESLINTEGTRTKYVSPYSSTRYAVTNCGSPCVWQESSGTWSLLEYGCISPCNCSEPDRLPAYEAERVTTTCFEMLVNEFLVRNADFVAPTSPLAGWDIVGSVTVVETYDGIDEADLPMVEMVSTLTDDATISQRYIPVTRGKPYKIVLDAWIKTGTCVIEMVESGDVTYRYSFAESLGIEQLEASGYIPRVSNPTVVIRSKPTTTSVGTVIMGRLGFVRLGS